MGAEPLKMYDDLAIWWRLLSPPESYAEEAAFYLSLLKPAAASEARSVLELGCGGGHNASHLKRHFEMTLIDLSPRMLEQSKEINPECEHVVGDMRTVRLGRTFDRVFVHDAVCYMSSVEDLRRAMETAFLHCRPGGSAVFAPDHVRETFTSETEHGGSDSKPHALRYLAWTHDPDPNDDVYTVDYAFLLLDADGSIRVEHDRHVEGLFSRETWLRLLAEVGFEPHVAPFEHSEISRELLVFVGDRPLIS